MSQPIRLSLLLCVSTLLACAVTMLSTHAEEPPSSTLPLLTLTGVKPQGANVTPPEQIVFSFSAPVVPLGRMERSPSEIGISFSPSLDCQWRWLDTFSLACILDEAKRPRPATKYSIKVPQRFDLTTKSVLDSELSYNFTTQTPTLTATFFRSWHSPVLPELAVALSQSVVLASLSEHLFFEDAQGVRYPADFKDILEVSNTEENREHIPSPSEKGTRWIMSPKQPLPAGRVIQVHVTPGLTPLVGTERGQEDKIAVTFQTFEDLRFLGVSCQDLKGGSIFLDANITSTTKERCNPLSAIYLAFNAPILKEGIKDALTSTPDLRGGRTDFDPWEDVSSYSRLDQGHVIDQRYLIPLPYGLKANVEYTFSAQPNSIRDEFGRTLSSSLLARIPTSHRAPRLVVDNHISVLEKDVDSKLPVIVNNIKSLTLTYQAVTSSSNRRGLSKTITPYDVTDVAYPFPLDIRELLGGRSGVVQGKLSSTPSSNEGSEWLFSQVTPFEVHVKLGHFNSLVWVTSFANGKPVSNAKVSVLADTMTSFSQAPKQLASGITSDVGIAMLAGVKDLDPGLDIASEWEHSKTRLIFKVEKDGDLAYVPISWDFEVYSDSFYASSTPNFGHIHTWGTTAQGLYKAGDTVQFAVWVRNQNNDTFVAAPQGDYTLEVSDPMGKVVFTVPNIKLSEFGAFNGEFTTKTNAAVGWYTFQLRSSFTTQVWEPLKVLISDFTPAPFKVSSELRGTRFHSVDPVVAITQARLHAGGPYADASSRITATVEQAAIVINEPALQKFTFTSEETSTQQVYQQELKLDSKGDLTTSFTLPEVTLPYGNLIVESAVRDDRGKFVASQARAQFLGRDRFAGILQSDWLLTAGKESTIQGAVIGEDGRFAPATQYRITAEYQEVTAARVKGPGNAYLTRYNTEWKQVKTCELNSAQSPQSCAFTPAKPGYYRLTALVTDSKGRQHSSSTERYAIGSGQVLWESGNNTDLEIVPEKLSYKVGETAKFFIRNPFPGARALLTTERYGIQRSWTQDLPDSSTIIELPITRDHIPAVYLSATIVSPRVDKPIENQVDLGKPAFRMGYAKVDVVDSSKELRIEVKPSVAQTKPGESVSVELTARGASGDTLPVEFAVTVLDESVFDLISRGKDYFDPYRGFYVLDGLDVRNFNLIKMLVGRQKFEKKGANPGGDGGSKLDMRSIKKYVSYWNPAIRADQNGKASFSFVAPDNLTNWRVFAIALTKDDQMGLGQGAFKVSKDTEVRSALPNQVRLGDSFTATFTVMNRSETVRDLNVEIRAEGDAARVESTTKKIHAEPFKRYPVDARVTAEHLGEVILVARASDSIGSDGLIGRVPILERLAPVTAASFGSSLGAKVSEAVSFPPDLQPGSGTVGVVIAPSVLGSLKGAFEYMRTYPYLCWEQKLSKGAMAAQFKALARYLPRSFTWQDSEELVRETLAQLSQHQAPNGGMTFFQPSDEHVSAYLSAYTALALSWLADQGYTVPAQEETKLQGYLRELLKKDDFPSFFSPGMKSSVRAVALAALAKRGAGELQDILRYKKAVGEMNLFGKANYLRAAIALKADSSIIADVARQIMAAGTESAASYSLTEPVEATSQRILDTNMRTQCAVLDVFLALEDGHAKLSERVKAIVPKLVHSVTNDRKRKDRWENTQENLFCMNALARYSARYETVSPDLALSVAVGDEHLATVAVKGVSGEPQEVSRPLKASDVGRNDRVTINPSGTGRFYYTTRLSYSPKELSRSSINAGMEVVREYSVLRNGNWSILRNPVSVQQGELLKVDLFVRIPTARHFVVVDDLIPGGLEAVNRDLATASTVDASRAQFEGAANSYWFDLREWIDFGATFWSFYHKELRHTAARFYSEYLPAGNYHLSYIAQAIAVGDFAIPPTHAEEMYDPDVFGNSKADTLKVTP